MTGFEHVGGLVGYNRSSSTVSNSNSSSSVSGTNYVGGLVGNNEGSAVDTSYATGSVTGDYHIGGLVGYNNSSTVSNSNSTGPVTGIDNVGGLVGYNYSSTVSNCYSTGSVSNTTKYVGGLIGLNRSSTVSNSYATGSVSGSLNSLGGLVGYNDGSAVSNSYATGSVNVPANAGGLVGLNQNAGADISNCYSTGSVTGTSNVGGLVGINQNSGTVSDSFWDTQTSNQSSSDGGTGKTTAEMKDVATFTDASWDFVGENSNGSNYYWDMNPIAVNDGYPSLSWQVTSITWSGTTNTDWLTSTNWIDGLGTTLDRDAVIPNESHDPIIAETPGSPAVCKDLTLSSGATLVINEGKALTTTGDLSNSGTITVNSSATGTGSLIVEGTATGNVTVERYLIADKWHYISGQTNISGNFDALSMGLTGGVSQDQFYRWEEDLIWGGNTGNWVDILNGPDGNNSTIGSEGFVDCKGYGINYITTDETLSLSGVPYTANQSIDITKTSGSTSEGVNLVGNPFTSTIAANNNASTSSFLSTNISQLDETYSGIYLWDEQASYQGNRDDYTTISNSEAAKYIEVGQAFMIIKKDVGTTTLPFNINMRKHGSATFYKNTEQDEVSRFYMSVENNEGLYNEILIAFIEEMTNGLDISYDAGKLKGNPDIALYTSLIEDIGSDFAHQALPPLTDEVVEVKIGLDVSNAGNYSFKIKELQNFDETISIKLEDKLTGSLIDFRQAEEYSFFIDTPGEIRERFVLHFNGVTGIEDEGHITKATIQTYAFNNTLYILNPQMKRGTVTIFNLTGQKVATLELTGDTKQQQTLNVKDIINIVQIKTDNEVISKKVVFK